MKTCQWKNWRIESKLFCYHRYWRLGNSTIDQKKTLNPLGRGVFLGVDFLWSRRSGQIMGICIRLYCIDPPLWVLRLLSEVIKASFESSSLSFTTHKYCLLMIRRHPLFIIHKHPSIIWQIPLKMLFSRNPQNWKTEIPQYQSKLNQILNLNSYCKIQRNPSFSIWWSLAV